MITVRIILKKNQKWKNTVVARKHICQVEKASPTELLEYANNKIVND